MTMFEQTLGLTANMDVISLAPGLHVQGGFLVDDFAGAQHALAPSATGALVALESPRVIGDWMRASELRTSEAAELIRFLDSIAGLVVQQTRRERCTMVPKRILLRVKGVRVVTPAYRYLGSGMGIVRAVSRSTTRLALAIAGVVPLVMANNLFGNAIALGQVVLLASVYGSTIVHEYVHLRFVQGQSAVIVRGTRIGILHTATSAQAELYSALAGPLIGALTASVVCMGAYLLHQPVPVIVSAGLVPVFHLCSWLPEYGDGKAIKRFIKVMYA